MMAKRVTVNIERLSEELRSLATFSDAAAPAVTRILYTHQDMQARAWLAEKMRAANLSVREDAVGNLFARWTGSDPSAPCVGTGSHCDAIPESGMYDGTVGVLGGLEAIRALQEVGFRPQRSIEVLMFTAEEPTRFGVGCVGSRLLSGAYDAEWAATLHDKEGLTLDETRAAAGFAGEIAGVALGNDYYAAFVELHIEQGPLLEKEDIPIGIVSAIAAPAALRVTFTGSGGHAGTVLMPDRRDALLPAAELALAVEAVALSTGSIDTVATTGVLDVYPRAINSIPSRTMMEIDVRDTDEELRNVTVEGIRLSALELAERRNVQCDIRILNSDPPATCAQKIVEAIEDAAVALSLPTRRMVSRAYHDSLFMARISPTGMIFIPCRDGVSHRPDEFASPEAIRSGVEVLAGCLARLAGGDFE